MQRFMGGKIVGAHQVILDLHIGSAGAALQIEEIHGVVCAAGEGFNRPVFFNFPAKSILGLLLADRRDYQVIDRGSMHIVVIFMVLHHHFARGKVDAQVLSGMNAAHVADQNPVDKDPHVVVAGEFIDHVLVFTGGIEHFAVIGH